MFIFVKEFPREKKKRKQNKLFFSEQTKTHVKRTMLPDRKKEKDSADAAVNPILDY